MTNIFPRDDKSAHRKAGVKNPGEQALSCHSEALTGNASVTLTAVMTRKIKPPIVIYSALADATRCRIIEILLAGPIPVHRLSDAFSISRPAISRHLRVLKSAGLVAEVKKGRENLYALRPARLAKARDWIEVISAEPAIDAPVPEAVRGVAEPIVVETLPVAQPTVIEAASVEKPAPILRPRKAAPQNQMGFDF